MSEVNKAIEWFRLSKDIQKQATKAMIDTNGTKQLGKSYLSEMKDRLSHYNLAIKTLKKEIPQKVTVGNYNPDSDSYTLHCVRCKEHVGSLDNEDNDGSYKYNIYGNYCPNCGQKIIQNYTKKDYKKWGI